MRSFLILTLILILLFSSKTVRNKLKEKFGGGKAGMIKGVVLITFGLYFLFSLTLTLRSCINPS